MSVGHGGYMNLIEADDTMLIYGYCCYNLNCDGCMEMSKKEDGEIYIDRDALVVPEIHSKIKRMPSGRKKCITKRIPREYSISNLIETKKILVKNASGTWKTTEDGIDIMAIKMLYKLFYEYQIMGDVVEEISIFY